MNKFPVNAARWQTGLTLNDFVEGMTIHQADMRRRLREVRLSPADREHFTRLGRPIHALVMTEDWCGDGVMNLPILARIVEAAPEMDMRIFIRSEAPDLNDYYAARGITHIPVFTFLDADFNEIGTWVERPQAAQARVKDWVAAHPEIKAIRHDPGLTPEARQAKLRQISAGMLVEMEGWYADGLQQATVDEIKSLF